MVGVTLRVFHLLIEHLVLNFKIVCQNKSLSDKILNNLLFWLFFIILKNFTWNFFRHHICWFFIGDWNFVSRISRNVFVFDHDCRIFFMRKIWFWRSCLGNIPFGISTFSFLELILKLSFKAVGPVGEILKIFWALC